MLVVLAGTAQPAANKGQAKAHYFKGKVVPLADLLKKSGARLDPEASPHWLALVTENGKVYPLIKEDASRIFAALTGEVKMPLSRPLQSPDATCAWKEASRSSFRSSLASRCARSYR